MSQSVIGKLTGALGAIALGALTYVLVSSMGLSEKIYADRPSVPMPVLKPGQYAYIKDPIAPVNQPSDLLFIRNPDGRLKVWLVPLNGNEYLMPDIHWGQYGPRCILFKPNFDTGKITCEDGTWGDWARQNYQWNLDGKNLGNFGVDDMFAVNGEEELGRYFLYKKR